VSALYGKGDGNGYGYGYGYGYGCGDGSGGWYGDGHPEQEIGGPRVSLSTSAAREGFDGLTVSDALTFALGGRP